MKYSTECEDRVVISGFVLSAIVSCSHFGEDVYAVALHVMQSAAFAVVPVWVLGSSMRGDKRGSRHMAIVSLRYALSLVVGVSPVVASRLTWGKHGDLLVVVWTACAILWIPSGLLYLDRRVRSRN